MNRKASATSRNSVARTRRRLRAPKGEHDPEVPTLLGRNGRVPTPEEAVIGPSDLIARRARHRVQHDDVVTIVGGLDRPFDTDQIREVVANQGNREVDASRCRLGFTTEGSHGVHVESIRIPGDRRATI